jgi:hypothetical protein
VSPDPIPVDTDDDIRGFRRLFMGPTGMTLPWEASFKAYGVFAGLAVVALWLLVGVLGRPVLTTATVYVLGACILLTRGIMSRTDSETPLKALPSITAATMRAGRTTDVPRITKVDNASVRIVPDPWESSVQQIAGRR